MSDIVNQASGGLDNYINDAFSGMNMDRLNQGGSGEAVGSAGKYAALALAIKGSQYIVDTTGNPEAPFCYMVNASSPLYKPLKASGFIEKPDVKGELQICSDTDGTVITLNAFAGYPVYLETTAALNYYNGAYNNICQVAGYRVKAGGELMNVAPSVPMRSMYGYSATENKLDFKTPSETVSTLDPIGTRGELCSQCIRNGHSTDKNDLGAFISCSPTGYMYVVVTHIVSMKKGSSVVNGKSIETTTINSKQGFKPIGNFFDEEGNPLNNLIICIKLARGSLTGVVSKENPALSINGPIQYLNSLKSLYSNPELQDASKHLTLFSNKLPIDKDGKSSKYTQVDMRHVSSFYERNLEEYGLADFNNEVEAAKAMEHWKKARPSIDLQVIPEPDTNKPGTVEVLSTETVISTKPASKFQESDDDWNDFNFQ